MTKTKIVIAGGGFAGLYAAKYLNKKLARRADIEVTLISRENFILFTPMLHEVAAGDLSPGDIVNPQRRIRRRLRGGSGWLRNGEFLAANRSARYSGGDKGGEEHRSRDRRA